MVATPRFVARSLAVGAIGPIDIALFAGQCLGLAAPSGAGKSRLLRAMADLEAHDGECLLDGHAAGEYEAPAWRRRVMYFAAEPAWWFDTTGEHMPDAPIDPWLDAVALEPVLLRRALAQLSSGQRQRLALVRLLAHEPDVLLLDEPTASLDPANVERVERLIRAELDRRRACAVWVSHDSAQIERVADQQLILDARGQPLSERPPCN